MRSSREHVSNKTFCHEHISASQHIGRWPMRDVPLATNAIKDSTPGAARTQQLPSTSPRRPRRRNVVRIFFHVLFNTDARVVRFKLTLLLQLAGETWPDVALKSSGIIRTLVWQPRILNGIYFLPSLKRLFLNGCLHKKSYICLHYNVSAS